MGVELPAPYLFIYHHRIQLSTLKDALPPPCRIQLSLLIDYVTEQYSDEYGAADALLAHKKIAPRYIRYLFKPGDLLVSRVNDQYMCYVSTSWPKINYQETISRTGAPTSGYSKSIPLYGSQEAEALAANHSITVHVCKVDVWQWAFDGNFERQFTELQLEIPVAGDKARNLGLKGKAEDSVKSGKPKDLEDEINISDLNVFPIAYAAAAIIDNCRRRGKTFWKCRRRTYVS